MCKVKDAVSKLTLAEQATLGFIGQGPAETMVQTNHANKLMVMGLAIPFNGQLRHTPFGRQAAALAQETSRHARDWWNQTRH
ncbi:MAG: hypothetical protein AAF557_23915 [Pseudomonadota bacterium]